MKRVVNDISKKIVLLFFGFFTLLYAVGNILFTVRMDELITNIVSFNSGITIVNIICLLVLLILINILIKNDFFNIF